MCDFLSGLLYAKLLSKCLALFFIGLEKMELPVADQYEIINGRKVLKKHVATIHCSNKLSLLERKISNALLFHAFPQLQDELIHEITMEQLKRLLGANTRNHKALKDALKTLISTVIEWNLMGDAVPEMELEGWNASTILSSVSVKRGVIRYQYSELIKTLIVDPAIYGKINLVIQSRFKSSYALALYENCARYRGLSYTKDIDISLFRKLMGVEEGKYEIFRDFNRRVLNPAVTEINTCSDIRVTPEIFRRGRKVQSIKFKIEERPIKQRIGRQSEVPVTRVKNIGMNQQTLSQLVKEYGEKSVNKAVDYVSTRSAYQNGAVDNIAGYVRAAITKGYATRKNILDKKSEPLNEKQLNEISWRLQKHEYFRHISRQMIAIFSQLPVSKQAKLIEKLKLKGQAVLGASADLLMSTHYNLLGNTDDRLQQAIANNNSHIVTFFENGFTEFLLTITDEFKSQVISFDDFKRLIQNEESACVN